jgi:hypothetical protein
MAEKPNAPVPLHELRLCFDGRNRWHLHLASLVHALDAWDQVELLDRPEQQLQLITQTGEILTGYALFEKLTRSLRLLWPLALVTWIPGLATVARTRFPGAAGS